jgi:hypothetical protein
VLLTVMKATLLPDLNRFLSPRVAAAAADEALPADGRLFLYHIYPGAFSYHLEHPHLYADGVERLDALLADGAPAVIVTTEGTARRVADHLAGFAPIGTYEVENQTITLLRRPAPTESH